MSTESVSAAFSWLRNCDELWQHCIAFIELQVMPLVLKLTPIFEVREKASGPFQDDIGRLMRLIDHYNAPGYPDPLELTIALRRLNAFRSPSDIDAAEFESSWNIVESELEWFQQLFFLPQGESRLLRLLRIARQICVTAI